MEQNTDEFKETSLLPVSQARYGKRLINPFGSYGKDRKKFTSASVIGMPISFLYFARSFEKKVIPALAIPMAGSIPPVWCMLDSS